MKSVYRKRLLLAAGILLLSPILALGFVKYALPLILMTRYTHQINETFDAFFTPDLKEHLDKMGISLETSKPAVCDNGPYSPSSPCSRFSGSGYIKLNSSSVEKWQQSSKQLDDYLVANGWERQTFEEYESSSRYGTFEGLLSNTTAYQVFAIYTRQQQGVKCSIAADYLQDVPYGSVSVSESCYKYSSSPSQWFK